MTELGTRIGVKIAQDIKTYGKVLIGENTIIEENVIIGHPYYEIFDGMKELKLEDKNLDKLDSQATIIGNDCFIKSGTIIYAGVNIGNNVYCGHNVLIGGYTTIGDFSKIFDGSRIYANVRIGKYARINGFCCDRSTIGDNVSMLGSLVHKYSIPIGGIKEKSPIIHDNTVIGWNAIVIGEIVINEGSYVGGGAVVTKDIPSYVFALGNPANSIRKREKINLEEIRNAQISKD